MPRLVSPAGNLECYFVCITVQALTEQSQRASGLDAKVSSADAAGSLKEKALAQLREQYALQKQQHIQVRSRVILHLTSGRSVHGPTQLSSLTQNGGSGT